MGMIAQNQQRQQSCPSVSDKTKNWSAKQWVSAYKGEIQKVLPKNLDPERFVRICLTEIGQSYQLQQCNPQSLIGAIMQAAQCGLEIGPTLGQAYLIPYKGKCTLQISYKGMIQLCRRSGEIAMIKAQTVYENDEFEYSLGLNPDLKHAPAKGDRGAPIAYYAFYKTKDGFVDFEVMTHEEVLAHAHRFSATSYKGVFKAGTPWATDFDAMAMKTVMKKVLKYAPMSTDVQRVMAADEAVTTIEVSQEAHELPPLDTMEVQQIETEEDTPIEINGQAGEIIEGEVIKSAE